MQHSDVRGHSVSLLMSYAVIPALSSFGLSLLTILALEYNQWIILLPQLLFIIISWYAVAFLFVQVFARIGRHYSIRVSGYSAAGGLLITILSSVSVYSQSIISLIVPPSYGYPFVYYIRGWQNSGLLMGPPLLNISLPYFLLDVLFWFTISFLITMAAAWLRRWSVPFIALCFAGSLAIMSVTYGITTLVLPGAGTFGGYYHGYPWPFIVTGSSTGVPTEYTFFALGFTSDFLFWFVIVYFAASVVSLLTQSAKRRKGNAKTFVTSESQR